VRGGRLTGYRVPTADITDEVDVDLTWTPDAALLPADAGAVRSAAEQADRPSLFTALQQQLGLRPQSGRERIPVIVVERAEKPAAN
jgi:uncharacterized protein (TIGR03435 family)